MSDKEIIIDDIDVLECCHWIYNNYCEAATSDDENHCDKNDDCYFKQLKRTEQKLEAFEMEANEAKEIIAELEHTNNQLIEENEFLKQTLEACEEEHRRILEEMKNE